ncbi:MAG: hypothetical protein WAM09_06755 [Anaerolineales bacterium]
MIDEKTADNFSLKRVIIKGVLLFLLTNLVFAPLAPLPILGQVSAYNVIFPGRVRLPYGENPDQAYNLSLYNLEAMFTSHELAAGDKPADEYRVLLIGDSSVWGYLLKPENTLSAVINTADLKLSDGKYVRTYNLGYPTLSLAKDFLILNYAMHYQPDLIVWLITLESLPLDKQLDSPILQNNTTKVQDFITTYSINLDLLDSRFVIPNFLASTLVGERRALADILRLQLYGVMWASTGIDQYYPASYEPPLENLPLDEAFHGLHPPELNPKDLSLDILSAGKIMSGNIPILYVNEPIYLSHGENSDIRYNFFYPRWVYDQYRQLFAETCQEESWQCLDEWNLVLPDDFTNSAIHLTPNGTRNLGSELEKAILSLANP